MTDLCMIAITDSLSCRPEKNETLQLNCGSMNDVNI